MASIDGKVGERCPNNFHDVALVQAMLRVIPNPKNQPYFLSHYDGVCGGGTINAIKAFQADQGTATTPVSAVPARPAAFGLPPLKGPALGMTPLQLAGGAPPTASRFGLNLPGLSLLDDPGAIKTGGPTLAKLNELLPPKYKQIRSAPGLHVIYWSGSAQAAASSAKEIGDNTEFHLEFRKNVASLVNKMFDAYEIVLTIARDGGRRTFQEQYVIATDPDHANAGPGESNHNFGQAVDIGFNRFKWMSPIGVEMTDDWWLNKMVTTHSAWTTEMWTLRNAIAFDELGMFESNKAGDYSHIQRYSDDDVSMVKSLAVLLDTAGAMHWRYHHGYECNLGFTGGAFRKVGTAMQIWDKTGPMEKPWIAAGRNVPVAAITNADLSNMRTALRADLEKAEAARDKWIAQPK